MQWPEPTPYKQVILDSCLAAFKQTTNPLIARRGGGGTPNIWWESSYLWKQGGHLCHGNADLFWARQEAAGEEHKAEWVIK